MWLKGLIFSLAAVLLLGFSLGCEPEQDPFEDPGGPEGFEEPGQPSPDPYGPPEEYAPPEEDPYEQPGEEPGF